MSNRNPNKQNTYSNLSSWCEKYHQDSGIKIHPSSVPMDVVLDDLLGQSMETIGHTTMITKTLELIAERFETLEEMLEILKEQTDHLEQKVYELSDVGINAKDTKKVKK